MNVEPARLRPSAGNERQHRNARRIALDCMMKALEHLDSDAGISPIVGSQLQLAIDRLKPSISEWSRFTERS